MSGCYLCSPEPIEGTGDEWNEACADCDRAFWANPVAILVDDGDEMGEYQFALGPES